MLWVTLCTLPILLVAVWFYTVATVKGRFPTLKNRRICLLIAHPDDEAMFFAPALLALTDPALGNHLKILCLSSGKCRQCRDCEKVANRIVQAMPMGWAKHERRSWSRAVCCSAYEMKTMCLLSRIRKLPPPPFPRTAITHSSLTPCPAATSKIA